MTRPKSPLSLNPTNEARKFTKRAIKTLVEIMMSPEHNAMARIAAAKEVLTRGWDKGDPTSDLEGADLTAAAEAILKRRAEAEKAAKEAPVDAFLA